MAKPTPAAAATTLPVLPDAGKDAPVKPSTSTHAAHKKVSPEDKDDYDKTALPPEGDVGAAGSAQAPLNPEQIVTNEPPKAGFVAVAAVAEGASSGISAGWLGAGAGAGALAAGGGGGGGGSSAAPASVTPAAATSSPSLSASGGLSSNSGKVVLTLTAASGATVNVYDDGKLVGTATEGTGDAKGTYSLSIDHAGEGQHHYTATAALPGASVSQASQPLAIVVDTIHPAATIATSNTDGVVSDADVKVTYTVNFSEAVKTLTADDLSVSGGTLDAKSIVLAGDGLSATFVLTANDNSSADLDVALKGSVTDLHGNALVADSHAANTLTVDTIHPATTIATSNTDGVVSDADAKVTYTVNFSEAVKTLTADDLSISGGTLDAKSIVLAGDGLSATFVLTANDNSSADLVVALKGSITDLHGNALVTDSHAANTLAVDTVNPTVSVVATNTGIDNDGNGFVTDADTTVSYTVTFSEAVTSLSKQDLSISGGELSGDGITLSEDHLSATFAVTANSHSNDPLVVAIQNSVTDLHGNALVTDSHASSTLAVDTTHPTVTSIVTNNAGVVTDANPSVGYTVTFSEAISSLSESDIQVSGGHVDSVTFNGGDTATFTVKADSGYLGDQTVSFSTSVTDWHGNNFIQGDQPASTIKVDTEHPQLLSLDTDFQGALSDGHPTATFTATFSEAVGTLTASDFVVDGGQIDAIQFSNSDHTAVSFKVTATDGHQGDSLSIAVKDSVQDVHGNALLVADGAHVSDAFNFAVDTLNPTASLSTNDVTEVGSDTGAVQYRVVFSEPVADFIQAAHSGSLDPYITISGGTLDAGSLNWEGEPGHVAVFTVTATPDSTANLDVHLNAGITDLVGNTLVPTTTTLLVDTTVHTDPPTLVIGLTLEPTAILQQDPATLTLSFNEKVKGLTEDNFAFDNQWGHIQAGSLHTTDGGNTWEAKVEAYSNVDPAQGLGVHFADSNHTVTDFNGVAYASPPSDAQAYENTVAAAIDEAPTLVDVQAGNVPLGESQSVHLTDVMHADGSADITLTLHFSEMVTPDSSLLAHVSGITSPLVFTAVDGTGGMDYAAHLVLPADAPPAAHTFDVTLDGTAHDSANQTLTMLNADTGTNYHYTFDIDPSPQITDNSIDLVNLPGLDGQLGTADDLTSLTFHFSETVNIASPGQPQFFDANGQALNITMALQTLDPSASDSTLAAVAPVESHSLTFILNNADSVDPVANIATVTIDPASTGITDAFGNTLLTPTLPLPAVHVV